VAGPGESGGEARPADRYARQGANDAFCAHLHFEIRNGNLKRIRGFRWSRPKSASWPTICRRRASSARTGGRISRSTRASIVDNEPRQQESGAFAPNRGSGSLAEVILRLERHGRCDVRWQRRDGLGECGPAAGRRPLRGPGLDTRVPCHDAARGVTPSTTLPASPSVRSTRTRSATSGPHWARTISARKAPGASHRQDRRAGQGVPGGVFRRRPLAAGGRSVVDTSLGK